MKKLLLAAALVAITTPAFAKEYVIKEISDPSAKKPFYFSPATLTIQPGDKVLFENAQDDTHDVMFNVVPKAVDEMIMSPPLEKKGEKFAYTFTIPGTYKFHCHPHEAAGMKGTLIVGQPSKTGQTKKVSHHDMAAHHADGKVIQVADGKPAAGGEVQGTGKILSVDTGKRVVKMKHDPIKALNWPTMTMLFTADSSVDLSKIKAGDTVTFTIKPQGDDDYVLTGVKRQ